jgi:hypothetical protein
MSLHGRSSVDNAKLSTDVAKSRLIEACNKAEYVLRDITRFGCVPRGEHGAYNTSRDRVTQQCLAQKERATVPLLDNMHDSEMLTTIRLYKLQVVDKAFKDGSCDSWYK